jgi:hypothetical protein
VTWQYRIETTGVSLDAFESPAATETVP